MQQDNSKKDNRLYPVRPILAVGGLLFQDEQVLLVRRAKDPGYGKWSIPGGAVKVGESLTEAVIREMAEEVGLYVTVGPLVEVVERVFRDEFGRITYHYVIMDYLCRVNSGVMTPGSDASDARMVGPEDWPLYELTDDTVSVLNKAGKLSLEYYPV
jgi:8-oxo-dGTP diphosphatase